MRPWHLACVIAVIAVVVLVLANWNAVVDSARKAMAAAMLGDAAPRPREPDDMDMHLKITGDATSRSEPTNGACSPLGGTAGVATNLPIAPEARQPRVTQTRAHNDRKPRAQTQNERPPQIRAAEIAPQHAVAERSECSTPVGHSTPAEHSTPVERSPPAERSPPVVESARPAEVPTIGQRLTCEALEQIYGVPFESIWARFLRNPETGHVLQLDCYNATLRIAAEYNGRQHYEFPNHCHRTYADFIQQVRRDRFKAEMCRRLGIYLIVVPHTVPYGQIFEYVRAATPEERAQRARQSTSISSSTTER